MKRGINCTLGNATKFERNVNAPFRSPTLYFAPDAGGADPMSPPGVHGYVLRLIVSATKKGPALPGSSIEWGRSDESAKGEAMRFTPPIGGLTNRHRLSRLGQRYAVTVTIPDRFLPPIVIALEHHAAYLNATKRDGRQFEEIVQKLQRNASPKATATPVLKSRRHVNRRRR